MIGVKFGGADSRSLNFLDKYRNVFVAYWLHRDQAAAVQFIGENWVAKGGRGFHGVTPEFCEDIKASGISEFQHVSCAEVYQAIQYVVARIRCYAHFERLDEGFIKLALICACQSSICQQLHGKAVRVPIVIKTIQKLTVKTPAEQGLELAKRIVSPHCQKVIPGLLSGDVINDEFVWNNYAFPPFYPGCFCRVEGVIEK